MATISIEGLETYYELHGEGHPLVLIAGYTCDHTYWTLMLPVLSQHFQVLIFDNRASGQTKDAGDSFSLETLANDTMKLVQALGLKQVHVLGHSMGGAIAQIIAAHYRDQVNQLIIMNSVAKFDSRSTEALAALLKLRQANVDIDLQLAAGIPWFVSNEFLADAEKVSAFKQLILSNPFPQSLKDQERQLATLAPFNSSAWLNKITCDTLIIVSEEDICTPPSESEVLAKGIKHSKMIKIPGAHASVMEQHSVINDAIINFLKN